MTKRQLLNRFLQLLLLALICYFFAPSFIDSFKKFNPSAWEINYPLLIASLLLMQVVLYAQSAIWSTASKNYRNDPTEARCDSSPTNRSNTSSPSSRPNSLRRVRNFLPLTSMRKSAYYSPIWTTRMPIIA